MRCEPIAFGNEAIDLCTLCDDGLLRTLYSCNPFVVVISDSSQPLAQVIDGVGSLLERVSFSYVLLG